MQERGITKGRIPPGAITSQECGCNLVHILLRSFVIMESPEVGMRSALA